MSDDKLKEYYGTQRRSFAGGPASGGNFYHGADLGTFTRAYLGTRGADSNFSRRTQALVPQDYFNMLEEESEELEEELEEVVEEVEEDYVVENSRYSLAKTVLMAEQVLTMAADPDDENIFNAIVDDILSDPTELARFERSAGNMAYEIGAELILRDVMSLPFTGTLGDEVIGIIRIIINIFIQIRSANNEMDTQEEIVRNYLDSLKSRQAKVQASQESREQEIRIIQSHIVKLQEIQSALYRDVSDTLQGVIALVPDDAFGPIAAAESLASKGAEFLPELLQKLEISNMSELELAIKREPELEGLKYAIAFLSGLKALSNFAPLKLGAIGVPMVILSLLNINIFNPEKILITGLRSIFVATELQNKLLFAIQVLKSDVSNIDYEDDIVTTQPEYYESSEEPDVKDSGSEFFRRLFISKPGDERFDESLEKRNLSYILETFEDIEKDTDDLITGEDEEKDDDEIEEFSGAGAGGGGPALPIGMSTKGSRGKKSGNYGGKPFPYSKEVKDKFYDYSRKTYGGK